MSINLWFTTIEIGNFLVAISTTGLMALGVIPMSLPLMITLALLLGVVGIVGRYLDSVKDDSERLRKYEESLTKNASGLVSNTVVDQRLQHEEPR